MAKKIKQLGAFLIALIIVVAAFSITFVSTANVESVKKVSAIVNNDNNIIVSWKNNEKLDGYNVYYCEENEKEKWNSIQVVGGKSDYVEFDDLKECSKYKFYVLGIRYIKDKIIESKDYSQVELFIPPKKEEIKTCYSHDKGVVSLKWAVNPNANGYQIKYSNNKDMTEAKTIKVDDSSVDSYEIKKLKTGSTIYFSVSAYAINEEENVYGKDSEIKGVTVSDKSLINGDIDPSKPVIALTFDDGPSYTGVTTKVLDLLEHYNVRATFFLIGENAKGNKSNVKRMVALGCEVGNHTLNHERYGKNVRPSDISNCSKIIYEITGKYPTAFRSTGGNTTNVIREECKKEGMPLYYWSVDTQDWKNRDTNKTYNNVINNVKDGDIVLMHDIYPSTAQAVERLIPELLSRGYQLVTVSELVTIKTGAPPVPGEQYLSATEIKNNTH